MSKQRMAVLIAMLFAAPAAVVALEQSTAEYTEPAQEVQATAEAVTGPEVAVEQTTVVEATEAPAQPMAGIQRAASSDTFPMGSIDSENVWNHLPRLVAYLDQLEQQRGSMVALGSSFPMGTEGEDYYQPLPAQIAYFNRLEQQRMASAQPQEPVVARSEVQAGASEERAQAGSAELAMIDIR